MANNDLVFCRPPFSGPPIDLIFGEPDEAPTGAAYAVGRIPLPAFMVAGSAWVTMPPLGTAAGAIALPAFMVRGVVHYDSATERPLVGKVVSAWQAAATVEVGTTARHQNAMKAQAGRIARWQRAVRAVGVTAAAWREGGRARNAVAARHQAADARHADTRLRYQEAMRAREGAAACWQAALAVDPAALGVRYQEAERLRRAADTRWQQARSIDHAHVERFGAARLVERAWLASWQAAMLPPLGRSDVAPPAEDPCYLPSAELRFRERQRFSSTLIFICERHRPPPGTGETVIVPILETYTVQNSITLVRMDSGEEIEALAFSMSLDADSWTWRWNATLPGSAWPVIRRGIHVAPVDILATVNGVPYRLSATDCNRDRRFAQTQVQVQGRGRGALLDAPYAPTLNHASASARSVAQLLDLALTYNGVNIGWGIDFGLTDWAVPGGTWAYQGSYIGAVLDIASAAGAIVQPHATDATLRVLPRYPAAPWYWNTLSPDYVLPAAAVSVEGIQPLTKPDYTRVFVAGMNAAGVVGQVTRSGTAGDNIAPMVTHALITHSDAVAQRGMTVLSDTGAQASVNLRLQVRPETGVILPGALVRYEDGAETHLGLVRATSVDWQRPVLRQSITLETHVEA